MFPGGHVNIQKREDAIEVAKNKAKQEAGIKINKFIDDDLQFPEYDHCKIMCSPCFTYRMLIDPHIHIECGHNEHIDYIFIGEYKPEDKADYNFIDIEIDINATSEKIKSLLENKITEDYKNRYNHKPKDIKLLEDIPERLYNAIQKYKRYKNLI